MLTLCLLSSSLATILPIKDLMQNPPAVRALLLS
jgi:hypothetical protein